MFKHVYVLLFLSKILLRSWFWKKLFQELINLKSKSQKWVNVWLRIYIKIANPKNYFAHIVSISYSMTHILSFNLYYYTACYSLAIRNLR